MPQAIARAITTRGSAAAWPRDARLGRQRYGAAFVELLEHLPTDRLNGKVAATVVVTIDHEQLRESLGAAHLDTGHDLSASEARRLACSAGFLPAVLGGTSLPLDLGRSNRFFTEAQRVALATTYDECAAEGCDRPYAWSELHHEDPWSRGRCDRPRPGRAALRLPPPARPRPHATNTTSSPTPTAARPSPSRRTEPSGRSRGDAESDAGLRCGAGRDARVRCADQPSALPRRTRRWPRRTSPATTAGRSRPARGRGVRGRPASRTASARARRSSVLGWGSG